MSLKFNGATQAVPMSTFPAQSNLSAVTLSGWIKLTNLPGSNTDASAIFVSAGSTASSRFKFGIMNTGFVISVVGGGRSANSDIVQTYTHSSTTVTTGVLYHIAATFDYTNKLIKLYQNGVLLSTSPTLVGWLSSTTDVSATLGQSIASRADTTANFVNGSLEDLRIYTRLLSDNELLTIFSAKGRDGIVSALQSRWLLKENYPGFATTATVKDERNTAISANAVASPVYDINYTHKRRYV